MGDSFNPHEILSRLRAKPSSSGSSSISGNNGSSSGAFHNSQPTAPAAVKDTAKSQASKAPSKMTAPSLALNVPQRQESSAVRIELEKEIKKLQDEISSLRNENKQLRGDKEDVERQFIEFKIKSEDQVTKLRGKVASLVFRGQQRPLDGTGKVYPVAGPAALSVHKSGKGHSSNKLYGSPPPPPQMGPALSQSLTNPLSPPEPPAGYQGAEGFRDPTFSELMRRSTADYPDFQESLRKSSTAKASISRATATKSFYGFDSPLNGAPYGQQGDQYDYFAPQGMHGGMMHSHPAADYLPEYDHTLPIVEIDLSKQ